MLAITPWRDDRLGADIHDGVHQLVGVISSIGQHGFGLDAVDEVLPLGHVVFLAGPSQEAAGIA